ncbi:MAG: type II toxin-antitoxin system Phd/YefM family antitoxin [Propionibacteriaceae bacterium]|jgi:PHD/YefM family antitoxin component YafN of YafNO toxin-antitoxin module|nr:type II toxin-antitoxin system Phd/YefM family antitoxin [Propionibacteriaceae bacterium]
MLTVTGAEFNRYPSRVKEQALAEPVIVTDRGKPSLVVVAHSEWDRLRHEPADEPNGWEALRPDEPLDVDFDLTDFIPSRRSEPARYWDFDLNDYGYLQPAPPPDPEVTP